MVLLSNEKTTISCATFLFCNQILSLLFLIIFFIKSVTETKPFLFSKIIHILPKFSEFFHSFIPYMDTHGKVVPKKCRKGRDTEPVINHAVPHLVHFSGRSPKPVQEFPSYRHEAPAGSNHRNLESSEYNTVPPP